MFLREMFSRERRNFRNKQNLTSDGALKPTGEILKQPVEEAQKIIADMDITTFVQFQRELQYALKYWSEAYQSAQTHIAGNDVGLHKSNAYDYYSNGKKRIDAIKESPLYDSVRQKIRSEFEGAENLSKNWAGWLGLEDKDLELINKSIATIFRAELPISGLIGGGVSAENLDEANKTIQEYDIQGLFVQNPTDTGLVATFHKHFSPK